MNPYDRTALRASVSLKAPYQDADPAGVIWHGNYFRYLDAARCALLDLIDYGYRRMQECGHVWPIVDTRVRYLKPIRYDQVVTVEARLIEWEYRLKIGYRISDESGRRLTEAWTVQVAVDAATGELCVGPPRALAERIDKLAS
ncbi:MAG: acyl-CoA thioesterase [Gammaproteobacteria bacterium]